MKILAIETSCDETSAAVVKDGTEVLSNAISTQIEFHKKYGGVVPEIAARKHVEMINPIIDEALAKASISLGEIDAIAVTYGPGLIGSLIVGVSAAKAIAWSIGKPLIAVNHLEGHIYANILMTNVGREISNVQFPMSNVFPFLSLLVSGGHTMIVLAKDHGQYEILGKTRDDAAGEAFDKVARLLGLGYPGGPVIDKVAKSGNPNAFAFKKPMMEAIYGYDFSFSGIKTAVVNLVKSFGDSPLPVADIAASFQRVVVETLVEKLIKSAKEKGTKNVTISGGVSANSLLRVKLKEDGEKEGLNVIIPSFEFCTDNAAMIGSAACYKFTKKEFADLSIKPVASLSL